jgi:hypothetical protein
VLHDDIIGDAFWVHHPEILGITLRSTASLAEDDGKSNAVSKASAED